jgi:hypothetical protein
MCSSVETNATGVDQTLGLDVDWGSLGDFDMNAVGISLVRNLKLSADWVVPGGDGVTGLDLWMSPASSAHRTLSDGLRVASNIKSSGLGLLSNLTIDDARLVAKRFA